MSAAWTLAGSSPLTRGKRALDDFRERVQRLIPAHAGKTGSRTTGARGSAAHPRSRGENPYLPLGIG